MPSKDKTITTATPPVPITVIGTGDGLVQGTTAKTPSDQPDIKINVVTPLMAVVIRFVNFYGAAVLGLAASAVTPQGRDVLYAGDFLTFLLTCASLALPGAILSSLKDILTITKRLEAKYPLLTGGV